MAKRVKDKRSIAIVLLALLLIAAVIVIVIGLFLTGRQGTNSLFRITYQARAVNAEVQASYRVEGSDSVVYLKSATGENFVSFDSSDPEAITKNLSMDDTVDLVEDVSRYVLFTYTFTNKNHSRDLRITMSDNATKQNVRVYYATSEEINGEDVDETLNYLNTTKFTDNNLRITCPKATEEENTHVSIYVLVSIVDKYADALYETSDNNLFAFSLESIL